MRTPDVDDIGHLVVVDGLSEDGKLLWNIFRAHPAGKGTSYKMTFEEFDPFSWKGFAIRSDNRNVP